MSTERKPTAPAHSLTTPTASERHPLLPHTIQPVSPPPSKPSTDLHGYSLMLLSTIGFATNSFFTHIAEHSYSFPVFTSAFIRGTVHTTLTTFCLLAFLPFRTLFSNLTPHQRRTLLFRGFIGSVDVCLLFLALRFLPVGDAITIFFSSPVITMIMCQFILSEPFTISEFIAGIVSFCGVALISRPGSGPSVNTTDRLIGSLCALSAAILSSMVYVAVRSMGQGVHFMISIFALSVGTVVVSVSLGGFMNPVQMLEMKQGAAAAFVAALFSFAGQCCLNKGLQLCRAGPGTLIRNLDVPLTYLLGLIFLAEKPTWSSLVGSCLVLTGTLIIGVLQLMRSSQSS